jgi:hypothetical protein
MGMLRATRHVPAWLQSPDSMIGVLTAVSRHCFSLEATTAAQDAVTQLQHARQQLQQAKRTNTPPSAAAAAAAGLGQAMAMAMAIERRMQQEEEEACARWQGVCAALHALLWGDAVAGVAWCHGQHRDAGSLHYAHLQLGRCMMAVGR